MGDVHCMRIVERHRVRIQEKPPACKYKNISEGGFLNVHFHFTLEGVHLRDRRVSYSVKEILRSAQDDMPPGLFSCFEKALNSRQGLRKIASR
jgi:hypothetical protein